MVIASPQLQKYFEEISLSVKKAYVVAEEARSKNLDPEKITPIPVAKNMAERVVGLISVVSPQITNTSITDRIAELEREYGKLDWRVGFKIAEEVASEKFCKFKTKQEALEVGIRVGFAYLTLGIVSAPLEGFVGLKLKKCRNGQEYFALQYAGPIRGAGGTAASTSVVLSDYVRLKMGYAAYDPENSEINRNAIEVHDYHERVTNLQYHPSDEELKFMLSHLPVEIDGDPTEKIEVSNYKDLPRIETNLIRGGMALVIAEGLTQKAPKLWKRLSKWGKDWGLQWEWLEDFIKIKEKVHSAHSVDNQTPEKRDSLKTVKPNNTFIMDMVAGRPILTHPLGSGGFRLRYGRARTTGFSATAVHPATMVVLDKYIAIGTQLKVERPGKAATVTVCDSIEGPIVRLVDGTVLQLRTEEEAKLHVNQVSEILFLGDILFNYGDFSENGQMLVPPGYCPEWWALEVKKTLSEQSQEQIAIKNFIQQPLLFSPSLEEAVFISNSLKVPLHPDYTLHWKELSIIELKELVSWLKEGKINTDENGIQKIILSCQWDGPLFKKGKRALELLGVSHKVINKENIVIEKTEAYSLLLPLAAKCPPDWNDLELKLAKYSGESVLVIINSLSPVKIRDKSGTFVGARMGRPEKSKMRHLAGSPQVMFPVGEEGSRLRSFQSAVEAGKINSAFPLFYCPFCNHQTIYPACELCFGECLKHFYCSFCGDLPTDACRHGKAHPYKILDLDIKHYFGQAKRLIGEPIIPDLIKGVRGTSNKNHLVENLAKGFLRAKHDVYVNKDGTTRYDCTELPITHFKPKEIKTSVNRLRELGYGFDIDGLPLTSEDQLLELRPQDLILPGFGYLGDSGPDVLRRVANFIDDLLVKFYKQDPFYKIKTTEDLTGQLVIGLAPHISAGLIGRIIGFSETQGLFASPLYHAGMRRDCDGDEACVMLLMDALLNFSRQFLPERRGAKTMDSPLVLTLILDPAEVDDQVHGMDVVWQYPLEFYEAALELKNPWEVKSLGKKIEQIGDRLDTPNQYEQFGFTHTTSNINKGVQCSAYKTLPSMEEKLIGQMEIAKKVRAVNMDDVAKLVIQKHFLKDIKGNLRKFSMQQFRCVKCNEKYRRPPLKGNCNRCNSRLIFTISEGSVVKYLKHSLTLSQKYDFSPYLKQTIDILKEQIEHVFGKEKETQTGLSGFMG